jgi:predicted esterase
VLPATPPPQPRLSLLALFSFITAILSPLGICFCYPTLIGSAIALLLGHVSLIRIWRSGGKQWGSVWAVLGLLIAYPLFGCGVIWLLLPAWPKLPEAQRTPAQIRLSEAETKIIGDSQGIAHGNSPRAKEMAETFSVSLKELREKLFTESKSKLKLSGGNFVVYCQLEQGRCAFIVHAPDLRHFSDEAEQSLAELAWVVGNSVALEELEDGDDLGVGLKGVLFYGAVMTGKIGRTEEPRMSKSSADLLPFFKPAEATPASAATRGEQEPSGQPTAPVERPGVPLELSPPTPPAAEQGEVHLDKTDSLLLSLRARQLVAEEKYDDAVQWQYWSVVNSEPPAGQYNLACYYSLAGNVDAALYWLQVAAEKEGVDAAWAAQDSDLDQVRADPRWARIKAFLQQYSRYWQASDARETVLYVPDGYDGKAPLPVIIGLHGMGDNAHHFVSEEYQDYADDLNAAFVGVSGSVPIGPGKFVWSEDPQRDAQRVEQALSDVADRLQVSPGQRMLYGFSQGAKMAVEIAARDPGQYAGALAMSPGGRRQPATGTLAPSATHSRQGYVLVCAAEESPGNVLLTERYADHMRRLAARVEHKAYPGVSAHAFPDDFAEQLPHWVDFILQPHAAER